MEKPAIKDTHAVELDASALGGEWQTALDGLDKDVNAVAVELKDASGKIYYESKVPGAIDCGAVSGGSAARSAIALLVDSDYYTIGRISTLHDPRQYRLVVRQIRHCSFPRSIFTAQRKFFCTASCVACRAAQGGRERTDAQENGCY